MKKLIFILLFLLVGCGQQQSPVDISMTSILWQGHPHEDSYYSFPQKFSETMTCLNSLDVYHDGEPFVIVLNDQFLANGSYTGGYYYNNTVYVEKLQVDPSTTIIGSDVFKHEIVHWATGLGDSQAEHDSVYFDCAKI